MNVFHFNKYGEPLPNESGRAREMADTREVAKIYSVISDKYISATQQVLALFKAAQSCWTCQDCTFDYSKQRIKSSGLQTYQHKSNNKVGSMNKKKSRKSDIWEIIYRHDQYDCVFY